MLFHGNFNLLMKLIVRGGTGWNRFGKKDVKRPVTEVDHTIHHHKGDFYEQKEVL